MKELWDLYDENRNLVATNHVRGEDLPQGMYHLCVHVWIRNRKGQYIISQRSETRKSNPLKWECVGGSVVKGEDSYTSALRETLEEVGVDLTGCNGKVVFTKVRDTINNKKFNDILDVWLFEYNGEINLKNATTAEVKQSKWLTPNEIKELINNKTFVETLNYFENEIENFKM